MKKAIIIAFFIVLYCANLASSETMRLYWKEKVGKKNKTHSYMIYVGHKTRNYTQQRGFNGKTLAIDISSLPLKVDSANYIAATKNNVPVYSSEIVILWTGNKPDTDQDGLSDQFEKKLGTDPQKEDSDEDEIPDGEEYATWGPKKWNLDFDEDGLINLLDSDSNGDGVKDGQDSTLRRIPFFHSSSVSQLNDDSKTFVHLYQNRTKKSELRDGTAEVTLKWEHEAKKRGMRYRVYSRTQKEKDDKKPYNYDYWEEETNEKTATISKLEKKETYYFVVRALYPSGQLSGDSKELGVTIPNKDKKKPKKEEVTGDNH